LIGRPVDGHSHEYRGPGSRRRFDFERGANERGAFTHSDESEAPIGSFRLCLEATAVVFDHEENIAAAPFENDLHAGGLRMFRDVCERFLRDAVEGGLCIRRKPLIEESRRVK
jgi:hypothetical protein